MEPTLKFRPFDPSKTPPLPSHEGVTGLQAYVNLMEHFLPPGWLGRTQDHDHPAVRRLRICREILAQDGLINVTNDLSMLPELAETMLDAVVLVSASKGNLAELSPGKFENYGGEEKAKMIVSRLTNREHYSDIQAELTLAAWHMTRGHEVFGIERSGEPDMRIRVPSLQVPVFAECKRIKGVNLKRLSKEIQEVSRRLARQAEPHIGVGFFHISRPLGKPNANPRSAPPPWIMNLANHAVREMRTDKNTGVALAVLSWDDWFLLKNSDSTYAEIHLARNSLEIQHAPGEGIPVVPDAEPIFQGFETALALHYREDLSSASVAT